MTARRCTAEFESALAAALLVGLAGIASPVLGQPISEAETALFLSEHLKSLPSNATLRYSFSKTGSLESPISDTVEVRVSGAGAERRVTVRCLTEAGQRADAPPIERAVGNPVLQCFLDRDLQEMKRLTGARNENYFRKRIKLAFAESAQMRQVTVDHNGRQVAAREIRISPYLDDPMREKFERYIAKYYVFTLSDDVPGVVFRIEAVIPDRSGGAGEQPPLIQEVLSFTGASAGGGGKK